MSFLLPLLCRNKKSEGVRFNQRKSGVSLQMLLVFSNARMIGNVTRLLTCFEAAASQATLPTVTAAPALSTDGKVTQKAFLELRIIQDYSSQVGFAIRSLALLRIQPSSIIALACMSPANGYFACDFLSARTLDG